MTHVSGELSRLNGSSRGDAKYHHAEKHGDNYGHDNGKFDEGRASSAVVPTPATWRE